MNRIKIFFLFFVSIVSVTSVWAEEDPFVEYTSQDSLLVCTLLEEVKKECKEEHPMVWFAKKMLGTPYVGYTLENGDTEHLIVNLHELDCVTLIETVTALTLCDKNDQRTFQDYCNYLTQIRYRDGKLTDYTSRLHYMTWWGEDNELRGLVHEIGRKGKLNEWGEVWDSTKTLNLSKMSANASKYKQLAAHPEFIPVIQKYEEASKGKEYRYIPKEYVGKSKSTDLGLIHSGDILAIVSNQPNHDISHVGIAVWKNDKLHLLHASSVAKKVILDSQTLYQYQQTKKTQKGIRVFRVVE